MHPGELERAVDLALRRLRPVVAPPTLLPRVLDAVRHRLQRPWYERPWFNWPAGLQTAAALALVAALAAGAFMWPIVDRVLVDALFAIVGGWVEPLAAVSADVMTVFNTVAVLRRLLVGDVLGYVIAVTAVMCMACAAFGAALTRMALLGVDGTWDGTR
jgi:hypothetical protein